MTNNEKNAMLGYLEFALTEMVGNLEKNGILNGSPQVSEVYDAAYEVLNEMERTLTEHVEVVQEERQLKFTK